MNLSVSKDKELRNRGRSWLAYIGVLTLDEEDIIQDAMLRLYKDHKRCSHVEQDHFADKNWKKMLKSAMVNWVVKRQRYDAMLERYADDLSTWEHREPFILEARSLLLAGLPLLTENELLIVMALIENDFKVEHAAAELGCARQNIYQSLYRMRKRLHAAFDLTRNENSRGHGAEVEYRWKTGAYSDESWTTNHPTRTEVFDIDEITRDEFRDREETEKVWPVNNFWEGEV